ncbi:DUF3499 domain-containing protein [Amycolatopsis sp. H6(2020)]|nr:DUF3499 domain-containing protein [Amycolatopsis sp. H6(2020)]
MAENKRLCSRTMCRREADWTLTYAYADSTAVIGPLAPRVEPHAYDLCTFHADRLTAPRGWEVVRVGQDAAAPGDPEADTASEPSQPSSEAQSPEAGDARTRLRGLPTRR